MRALFDRIVNKYHYKIESIKNRYPCKIVNIQNLGCSEKEPNIIYCAGSKINIRESTAKEILDDPLLIEKFHPTDGVKLGFIAFGQLILKEKNDDAQINLYKKISENMFKNK